MNTYACNNLDKPPSSSSNTMVVKSTNPTTMATGVYAANVIKKYRFTLCL